MISLSYRTYIEGVQIFGNNEFYPEWVEYLQSQGIEIDEDCCYNGEITDFMGALEVIENITLRLETEHRSIHVAKYSEENFVTNKDGKRYYSLFDLSDIYDKTISEKEKDSTHKLSLIGRLKDIEKMGYMFMPLTFFNLCKNKLVRAEKPINGYLYSYILKDGETIKVSGG